MYLLGYISLVPLEKTKSTKFLLNNPSDIDTPYTNPHYFQKEIYTL